MYKLQRQRKNPLKKLLMLGGVLIILFGLGLFIYWNNLISPLSNDQTKKAFVIQKGESVSSISQRLQDDGLIRSELAFKILLKLSGDKAIIEAGTFQIAPSMSTQEVLNSLHGGADDVWVKLLEGWRVEEMAEELHRQLGINKAEFIQKAKPKQGYLFPDSYLFNKEVVIDDIILTLERTFNERYTKEIQDKIKAQGLTPEEGVILASLVEREARTEEIRTQVAGIMLKRLNIGMKLDLDATVQYAMGYQEDQKSWWRKGLLYSDLEINSPYNTYTNSGLPPTPIANPSISSLRAVANADADTDYLYYFHDDEGNTYYGRTLDEHNANVANNR